MKNLLNSEKKMDAIHLDKNYYAELDWFRGFAIFSVIFGHVHGAWGNFSGTYLQSSWSHLLSLFQLAYSPGGTSFFVFISGFLFYGIFYKRGFNYRKFIRDKLLKVFLPYLIYATILTLWQIWHFWPVIFSSDYIINCYTFYSFWYVPFIMCMFLISPFFLAIIKLALKWRLLILLLALAVSFIVGRHGGNPLLTTIYFLPVYLCGLLVAQSYENFKSLNSNIKWSFVYITIGFMCCLISCGIFIERGAGNWEIKFFNPCNLVLLAKACACIIFMWLFLWLKRSNLNLIKKLLSLLASYSFAIFFFQQFPLLYFSFYPPKEFLLQFSYWEKQILCILISFLFCFGTILIFAPLKKLLGRYSRMIIGC